MLPTRRGIVLVIAALVLYVLAYYSHVGWYYVADALAWALLLVNLALPWWSLRGLTVTRRLALLDRLQGEGVFEGDAVQITLELSNRGSVPRFFFRVVEPCPLAAPGQEEQRYLVGCVARHAQLPIRYQVVCYQRGEYRFDALLLESSLPFGLFRARRRVAAPLQVLVYPQVLQYAGERRGTGPLEGPALARPARSPGEFRGSREYHPGDSLRHIHWRRSLREGQLMVKEYDAGPQSRVIVLFNGGKSFGAGKETTLEYAIKLAASIARTCFVQGTSLRMAPPGPEVGFPDGHALLAYLAKLKPGEALSPQQVLALERFPGSVVAILSTADPEGFGLLARLSPGKVAAVLGLHGFASELEDPRLLEAARREGIPVVTCAPGGAGAALELLASAGLSRTYSTSGLPVG